MGKFSQTFVAYHGCGNSYQDDTNKIDHKNRCTMKTHNPFWKKPIDVRDRVETRAQLKMKTKDSREYQRRYRKRVTLFLKDSFTSSDFDSGSDRDSETDIDSLANNASETEQNLSDNETNNKLIIDEKTDNRQHTDNK